MNIFVQFKSEHYYNVIKGQCHEENTTFESEQVFCTGRYLNNDQESVFFSVLRRKDQFLTVLLMMIDRDSKWILVSGPLWIRIRNPNTDPHCKNRIKV